MQRKKEIPKNPRFWLAAREAAKVLTDIEAYTLPVSITAIADHYPHIEILRYTELKERFPKVSGLFDFDGQNAVIDEMNKAEPDRAKWREHSEAAVQKMRGGDKYLIVFDDRVRSEQRKRWSISHELGHVFCGHLDDFEKTALNRSGLSDEEYAVLELEAHWFASELLAPTAVLTLLDTSLYAVKIDLLCGMSERAAEKKALLLKRGHTGRELDNRRLIYNFRDFIFQKGWLNALYKAIQERLKTEPGLFWSIYNICRVCPACGAFIEKPAHDHCQRCGEELKTPRGSGGRYPRGGDLYFPEGKIYEEPEGREIPRPARFKDAIEYYAWGYIRHAIRLKHPEGARLYAVLPDSAVFTDGAYYVLAYAGGCANVPYLIRSLPDIAYYIRTYGLTDVKDLYLCHYNSEQGTTDWYKVKSAPL